MLGVKSSKINMKNEDTFDIETKINVEDDDKSKLFGRKDTFSPSVGQIGKLRRRASISLPSGLNRLCQFVELSWHNEHDGEKDYFDEVAEAEAEKHSRHANDNIDHTSYNPTGSGLRDEIRGKRRKHSYALGEGAYDPIRSDSEVDELTSVDEMSEVESPSPLPKIKFRTPNNKRERSKSSPKSVHVVVDHSDGKEDEDSNGNDGKKSNKKKKSLATRRNKRGISPILIVNSNYKKSEPSDDTSSPTPSSASSIKNLIRDKLTIVSKSIPTVFMKRKADEYKLQAFVAILFLTIILLVGSIYVIHQEKELQKAYFNKIRFSAKDRKIRVSNLRGREVLQGMLGISLTGKDKAWPCLDKDQMEGQSCLEWMNKARLYFSLYEPTNDLTPSIQCYGILWQSLSSNFSPKDCFHIGEKKGFYFYGGGEMIGTTNQWPLNGTTIPLSPFISGNNNYIRNTQQQWGRNIKPYFVNSPGAIIQIGSDVPLHVSINDELHPSMICFVAKKDEFAYPTTIVPVKLNYTICTGENVRDVYTQLVDKSISDDLLQEDIHLAYTLTKAPIWKIPSQTLNAGLLTEASLLNHTDRIAALHLSEGIILLDESWQKYMGDFDMDPNKFPTISETFNITRRRGFKVALTIQPYFSTESTSYLGGITNHLWIRERNINIDSNEIPALTNYKSTSTAVVLDVTKTTSKDWLGEKINQVVHKYGIDALFLDLGTSQNFPQFYELYTPLNSPDEYKNIFISLVRQIGLGVTTIGVSGASKPPKLPTFVSLGPLESSWEGLQSIIPNFLTMGVSGFPFIMSGSVGGDYTKTNNTNDFETNKPDRNLYIRWLELVHFLPVIQYTYLPSDYDSYVIEIARNLNVIRNNKVYKSIRKTIEEALLNGLPIIRPLWMIDPNEPGCLKRWDEFLIGNDILVAPILTYNSTERNIYLPKGRWRDEMDGTSTKGDKWLNNYKVRENQIAFFTKLADSAL